MQSRSLNHMQEDLDRWMPLDNLQYIVDISRYIVDILPKNLTASSSHACVPQTLHFHDVSVINRYIDDITDIFPKLLSIDYR